MTALQRKFKISITGGLLLMLFCFFGILLARMQHSLDIFDLESYHPYGYKALNLLLHRNGYFPSLIKAIPLNTPRTAPIILITNGPLSPELHRRLLMWVEAGGTLIELSEFRPCFSGSGVNTRHLEKMTDQTARTDDPRFSGLSLTMKSENVYGATGPVHGLFSIMGQKIVFLRTVGRGKVIIWDDPLALTNRSLTECPDNGVIFAILMKHFTSSGKLYFKDVRFQSVPPTRHKRNFIQGWLDHTMVAELLLLIGTGICLWKLSARSARPRPLVLSRSRSANEFVVSLADLMQRAKMERFVINTLWQSLRAVLLEVTGSPRNVSVTSLVERIETLTHGNFHTILEIEELLGRQSLSISKKRFLALAITLDTYRKELLAWKKSKNSYSR